MRSRQQFHLWLPIVLFSICSSISSISAWGQVDQHWRFWVDPDKPFGLMIKDISVNPTGRVWGARFTGNWNTVDWMDGYSTGSLRKPQGVRLVCEGRSGQIWGMNYETRTERVVGVYLYSHTGEVSAGEWNRYDIDELKSASPLTPSATWAVPFLPGERDRLLILLTDRLMEFNAATNETKVLKTDLTN